MFISVKKLQRAALKSPVKIAVNSKYKTVDKNDQRYLFMPESHKECYLVSIVNELAGNSFMIFSSTCNKASLLSRLLPSRLAFTRASSSSSSLLINDRKYQFLQDLGLKENNSGVFDGEWKGSGEVSAV